MSGTHLDPLGRETKIAYTDYFNTTPAAATFAYPTSLTDAGGFTSTIKYRFDLGAHIWAQSPTPQGASEGKTTSRTYDEITGRLTKEKIENTGAYTRYDYPTSGLAAKSYTTITDLGEDGADSSDEVVSESLLDGAGRVLKSRTPNPNSIGGYSGKKVIYDILGRVIAESVPTEINLSWNPAGDDNRGTDPSGDPKWLLNQKEYDWKDRVTREINPDGNDRTYSYTGCGCAGGQVTTIKGEITEAIDIGGTKRDDKRRTQKIYADGMGRTIKTEIWDLDGAGSTPYSTTLNSFNGRDQIVRVREQVGTSGTYQDTTFEFDGHGRLMKSHKPEWFDSSSNATYTSYEYNPDDTVSLVTDPRGAETSYEYGTLTHASEHRALLTKVSYTTPDATNIRAPGDVSFVYDPAGNRKCMSDESGSLAYTYDELSRLVSESKTFAGVTDPHVLQYSYTLSGGIKAITDPHSTNGWTVTYTTDKIGRTTKVGNATDDDLYAGNISYRAFGGVKSMQYATTTPTNISLTYDTRLRPVTYEAESGANTTDIHNKTYTYNNDGSIKQATNTLEADYTQTYEYDFASRLKKNEMGGTSGPYKQTLGYDAFDNLTSRSTTHDGTTRSFTAGYTNNRVSSGGYGTSVQDTFDSAGNVIQNRASSTPLDQRTWKFDAAGRTAKWYETTDHIGTRWDQAEEITYDGDGRTAKRVKRKLQWVSPPADWVEETVYYLYSSVTGQEMREISGTGTRKVYFNGTVIAEHRNDSRGLVFKHTDPVAGSEILTETSGDIMHPEIGRTERAALNVIVPTVEPEVQYPTHDFSKGAPLKNPQECAVNGAPTGCDAMEATARSLGLLFGTHLIVDIYQTLGDPRERVLVSRVVVELFIVRDTPKVRDAFNTFLSDNQECAKLAKKFGLSDLLKNAKTIPVLGDLLKKKVTDLGFELGVVSTDPAFTMEHADLEGAEGLTNSKTKTIYLFGRAYTGTFGKNLNDTPADIARKNKIYLGAVVFHETFHLTIDGGHLPILKQLGIEFSPTGDNKKDEDAAADALDLFIKNGCKSDSAKKE